MFDLLLFSVGSGFVVVYFEYFGLLVFGNNLCVMYGLFGSGSVFGI